MSTKQSFLEVYERLVLLKNKVKEDVELSSEFKKGFAYCLRYISEAKEFDKVNLELENKRLNNKIDDLEYKIKQHTIEISRLKDNKVKGIEDFFIIELDIDGNEITLLSTANLEIINNFHEDMYSHIKSGKRKDVDLIRYTNKAINFIQSKGYKARLI